MSRLEKLIEELCPDGVEYHSLVDLFNIKNGYTPSKAKSEYWENGTIPWFRMDDIRENGQILSSASKYVTADAVKGKPFPENSIIISTSATIGEHALITVPSLANQRFTYLCLKDEYKSLFDKKFIYYYCFKLDAYCKRNLNQGNFASVDMKKFAQFNFPVPPLEVQREIVCILDKFTELTTELTTKLTMELSERNQQYEHYCNNIITSVNNKSDHVKLGQICEIYDGTHQTPRYTNSGIKFASVENINDLFGTTKFISEKDFETYKIRPQIGDVIMTRIGSIGTCAVINCNEPLAYYVSLALLRPNNNILNPRYLKYVIESSYGKRELRKRTLVNAVPIKINTGDIEKIIIPLPSLKIQIKVANILDEINVTYNDIFKSLAIEIDARQKQYEYYRDKLLTFKEKAA